MDEITKLTKYLAEDCRMGLVYICYRTQSGDWGGHWYVMVPLGNTMVPARDCSGATPLEAIKKAVERWENRSPQHPF